MASNKRVHEILEGLVGEVRETCNIGVLDGNEVVYIDRLPATGPAGTSRRQAAGCPPIAQRSANFCWRIERLANWSSI